MSCRQLLEKLNRRSTPIFPKIGKTFKVILTILIVFSIITLTTKIFAVDNVVKNTQDAQKKGNNLESWQLNSWNTTAINALTSLTGEIPFDDQGNMKLSNYVPSGMLGVANNMIASLYSPQASGIQYIAQLKDNFLGKPTYAQGVGFRKDQSLQPLLPMWRGFRNVVYILFSIVFIAIGLMIMLRVKISPQAVITVQSAIPGLITSLILVTFSYAIAGLIIDLSYLLQNIAIVLLFNAKGVFLDKNLFDWHNWQGTAALPLNIDIFTPYNLQGLSDANFTKLNLIVSGTVPLSSMFSLASAIGQVVLGNIVGGILGIVGSGGNIVGNVVGGVVGGIIGAIGGILMIVILLIMVMIWMIKLWFGLLKAYINIIISIITAPFVIGMGAFPNSKINFSSWLIGLISQVAIFPIVLVAIIFIAYLAEITSKCNLWVPNLLNMTAQLSSVCSGGFIRAAIGIAGLAMISKLPDLIPEAIFQLKPSPFGKAIGEGLKDVYAGTGAKFARQVGLEAGASSITRQYKAATTLEQEEGGPGPGKILKVLYTGVKAGRLSSKTNPIT